MSKKELLNETQIRRFMKLANLEPLAKNVISEMAEKEEKVEETMMPEQDAMQGLTGEVEAPAADGMGDATVEMGGEEADPEKQAAFKAAVQALADAMGISVELEGQEENAEEAGEEMPDMGGEEEASEEGPEEEDDAAEDKEEEEEMDEAMAKEEEGQKLSEDALVEAVLTRVTARLMEAAKKAKAKKKGVAAKMAGKKEEKKAEKKADKKDDKETLDEATSAEGGGPLLKQGKNKYDAWKGHADMAMAKGEKGGKGGHQMETVPAKSEHTVTHGGKNLATMGGNKKKV